MISFKYSVKDSNIPGVLTGFSGQKAEVCSYLDLPTTIGDQGQEKTVTLQYRVIKAPSANNVILGRPTCFERLSDISVLPSTLHEVPPTGRQNRYNPGDQATAWKFYAESTKVQTVQNKPTQLQDCGFLDLDPQLYDPAKEEKPPKLADDLKEIRIIPTSHQRTKIGATLTPGTEQRSTLQVPS